MGWRMHRAGSAWTQRHLIIGPMHACADRATRAAAIDALPTTSCTSDGATASRATTKLRRRAIPRRAVAAFAEFAHEIEERAGARRRSRARYEKWKWIDLRPAAGYRKDDGFASVLVRAARRRIGRVAPGMRGVCRFAGAHRREQA